MMQKVTEELDPRAVACRGGRRTANIRAPLGGGVK